MSDTMEFTEYVGSSRGLRARPVLPTDVLASPDNIHTINYRVKDMTTGITGAPVPLVVADVLFTVPRKWQKSPDGYTMLIPMPGSAWPSPGKWKIIVTLIPKDGGGNPIAAQAFSETWLCTAVDPEA